jgi:hypothetical protein
MNTELENEAKRLARVYCQQSSEFRSVLLDRLQQENPELCQLTLCYMLPLVYNERLETVRKRQTKARWMNRLFWLTVLVMWTLIAIVFWKNVQ